MAIVRFQPESSVDLLVLGDCSIAVGRADGSVELITDQRLDGLDLPEAAEYRSRLRSGRGYDGRHRELLAELQRSQQKRRNVAGGYWIPSNYPPAARHALTSTYPQGEVRWLVVATDGAADAITRLGIPWADVAGAAETALVELLEHCHRWESEVDPTGQAAPRSKRHDDKTIATIQLA